MILSIGDWFAVMAAVIVPEQKILSDANIPPPLRTFNPHEPKRTLRGEPS